MRPTQGTEQSPDAREEPTERSRWWTWTLASSSAHAGSTPRSGPTGASIVTALATLYDRGGGLIVALGQVGVIGGASREPVAPRPAPPAKPAVAGGSGTAERRLLEFVPAAIRDDCVSGRPRAPPSTARRRT
jgi:hypothetical protein